MFLDPTMNPLFHRLLPHEASHAGDGYHLEEAPEVATVFYLAMIRVKAISIHIIGKHYLTRIKALFVEKGNDANRSSFLDLKL